MEKENERIDKKRKRKRIENGKEKMKTKHTHTHTQNTASVRIWKTLRQSDRCGTKAMFFRL